MKVIILAGGFGTRLSEYTSKIPKPMITIGNKPLLEHIMEIYSKSGHKEFYIALGYKAEIIKDYFYKYKTIKSDFKINLSSGDIYSYESNSPNWNVSLINTGENSMTGGRILRLKKYISEDTFLFTYGDAVTALNINEVIAFHKKHKKLLTITAVRPPARFGEMKISTTSQITSFEEKPQIQEGWINGGYFVAEPGIFDYLDNDQTILERGPLEKIAKDGQLMAYKYEGFWQCVDTKRDKDNLNNLLHEGKIPWY